jgi:drug/metabolite transporter superfamily protein YnfA
VKNAKTRRGIGASLLATAGIGVSACAVCCAPPLVLAIGMLGVSGATAGALLSWWLPIIGVLMVVGAALLVIVPRRRAARCSGDDDRTTDCGCAGVIALGLYGFVATLQPDAHFGRILAAYGGVFVAGSLAWGMVLDGFRPDRWDVTGALICLVGVAVIMYAPRPA